MLVVHLKQWFVFFLDWARTPRALYPVLWFGKDQRYWW